METEQYNKYMNESFGCGKMQKQYLFYYFRTLKQTWDLCYDMKNYFTFSSIDYVKIWKTDEAIIPTTVGL